MTKVQKVSLVKSQEIHNRRMTRKDLMNAYNFHMANRLIESLRDDGLITKEEFEKLRKANVKAYAPYLTSLY